MKKRIKKPITPYCKLTEGITKEKIAVIYPSAHFDIEELHLINKEMEKLLASVKETYYSSNVSIERISERKLMDICRILLEKSKGTKKG